MANRGDEYEDDSLDDEDAGNDVSDDGQWQDLEATEGVPDQPPPFDECVFDQADRPIGKAEAHATIVAPPARSHLVRRRS